MQTRRIGIGLGAAAVATAALALGGLAGGSGSSPGAAAPPPAAAALLPGAAAADTATTVASLEARVAARPDDERSLALLGLAYAQRLRETGDASFLARASRALARANALAPRDPVALTGLASLAATRHQFRLAERLSRRAIALEPGSAGPFGILGDALVETGRLHAGFAAFDRMADLKPSLASYARVAYARELQGDVTGAREALRLAVEAGGGVPEHAAWSLVQLGNLELGSGRLVAAGRAYRAALVRLPGYASADAGLARVEAAHGHLDAAIRRLQAVVDRVPLPEFATRLADLNAAAGRREDAARAEGLVRTIERVLAANGVRTELETALFDLDRGVRLRDALARARDYEARSPSVQAEDVLAWALVRNGRCSEALAHSRLALRLGTRDALMRFHRGAALRCLGRQHAARAALREALAINPYFSVRWAPVARQWAR
jgi:tetratricopeptide (TPR) repeat protein